MEVACKCDWVPGLSAVPHTHRVEHRVRRLKDDIEFTFDAGWFLEQEGFQITSTEQVTQIWVDWKAVARGLCTTTKEED